jgi:hypothetical protein
MPPRIFYHGTRTAFAYSIMRQGFKIGQETHGRNLGNGLYLTARIGFAAEWGPIIIRCRLKRGTRILWHTKADVRTIRYLRKEFGAGILRPNFDTVIPKNKQLTLAEITQLWNFLLERHYPYRLAVRRDSYFKFVQNYPFIYKHLKRHGYDGVGMTAEDWPEIFLFNPSNALALSAHPFIVTNANSGVTSPAIEIGEPFSLAQLYDFQERALRSR